MKTLCSRFCGIFFFNRKMWWLKKILIIYGSNLSVCYNSPLPSPSSQGQFRAQIQTQVTLWNSAGIGHFCVYRHPLFDSHITLGVSYHLQFRDRESKPHEVKWLVRVSQIGKDRGRIWVKSTPQLENDQLGISGARMRKTFLPNSIACLPRSWVHYL